jgi:hypothetical protein
MAKCGPSCAEIKTWMVVAVPAGTLASFTSLIFLTVMAYSPYKVGAGLPILLGTLIKKQDPPLLSLNN